MTAGPAGWGMLGPWDPAGRIENRTATRGIIPSMPEWAGRRWQPNSLTFRGRRGLEAMEPISGCPTRTSLRVIGPDQLLHAQSEPGDGPTTAARGVAPGQARRAGAGKTPELRAAGPPWENLGKGLVTGGRRRSRNLFPGCQKPGWGLFGPKRKSAMTPFGLERGGKEFSLRLEQGILGDGSRS